MDFSALKPFVEHINQEFCRLFREFLIQKIKLRSDLLCCRSQRELFKEPLLEKLSVSSQSRQGVFVYRSTSVEFKKSCEIYDRSCLPRTYTESRRVCSNFRWKLPLQPFWLKLRTASALLSHACNDVSHAPAWASRRDRTVPCYLRGQRIRWLHPIWDKLGWNHRVCLCVAFLLV